MTARRRHIIYATRHSKAIYVPVKSRIRRIHPIFVQSHLRFLSENQGFTFVRSHNRYRFEVKVKSHYRLIHSKDQHNT